MIERGYSYKPAPRFFGTGNVFLGLELEVEAPSFEAKDAGLRNAGNPAWCYAKRDGSLGTYGWEMVTHPISISSWMSRQDVRDYHALTPGQTLTARYKGVTYTATVQADCTRVEWNGTVYTSISAAGKAIRGGKSTNGYQFFGLTRGTTDRINPVGGFFRLVNQLKELGYTSHDNERCGFHVHISRAAFGEGGNLHTPAFYRFKCLVNGLLFRKLSQRSQFRYCEQSPVDPADFWERSYNRYVAVNITDHTVEVRIFRGNLREARVRKNIEAVIAALEWSQTAEDYTTATDEQFIAYVAEHQDKFPNLHAYIETITGSGDQ